MRDAEIVVRGFDRPEIASPSRAATTTTARPARCWTGSSRTHPGPGIVYAVTQRETEELALALAERGVRSGAYHGGMPDRLREDTQEAFMDRGEIDVMVATIAFGMGVDKADVRFVVHHAVQRVGRRLLAGGRAGGPRPGARRGDPLLPPAGSRDAALPGLGPRRSRRHGPGGARAARVGRRGGRPARDRDEPAALQDARRDRAAPSRGGAHRASSPTTGWSRRRPASASWTTRRWRRRSTTPP